jgi:hypothetical protein
MMTVNMKRLRALVVCVFPVLALTACGGGSSSDNSVHKSVPLTPAPTNRVAETGSNPANTPAHHAVNGKGVNSTVPSSVKSEAQNNVNQLVNAINALH